MVYIYVGIAGFLGAILRYLIGLFFFTNSSFPYATLSINLLGSFLLSWLSTNLFKRSSLSASMKTAIGTGFIGSFTTFSTLSIEMVKLFENGRFLIGAFYIFVSIAGGLLMSRLGFKVSMEERQL